MENLCDDNFNEDVSEQLLKDLLNENLDFPSVTQKDIDDLQDIFGLNQQHSNSLPLHSLIDQVALNQETSCSETGILGSGDESKKKVISNTVSCGGDSSKRLCHVCFAPTANYLHYGGQVCGSCRGFFRRTVANSTHDSFRCAKDNRCVINSKSRQSCRYCRYQKCLSAGMNPKWIVTAEERKGELKEPRHKMLEKSSRRNHHGFVPISSTIKKPLAMPLTSEELLLLESKLDHLRQSYYKAVLNTLRRDPVAAVIVENLLLNEMEIPQELILKLEYNSRRVFEDTVIQIDEFGELDPVDRPKIVEASFGCFFSMIFSSFFNALDLNQHLHMLETHIGQYASTDIMIRKILEGMVEIDKQQKWKFIHYDVFYSSSCNNDKDIKIQHRKMINNLQSWPRLSPDVSYDEAMSALNICCMVFSPDGIPLKNRKVVEEIQTKYAILMYRYIKSKFGSSKAGPKYGKALMTHSIGKQAYEMHKLMFPNSTGDRTSITKNM